MTLVAELKQVITRRLEIASSDEIIEIVSQLAAAEKPAPFSFKNSASVQEVDAFAPRFIKGEGTVSDAQTGLIWSAEDLGAGQRYTWEEAKKAASALTLGGFSNWRLPKIRELQTLVDYERCKPAIDTDAFPSCKADWYWTSTPLASSPGDYAWLVGFGYGYAGWGYQSGSGLVRAVRPRQ